jgi:DNA polymerase III sliding clamp (beta) subunit (PCNA family)
VSKNGSVKLRVNGAITMSAEDPDLGEAEVVVPSIESNHEGKDLVVGFNSAYLRDALAAKDSDTFEVGFSGAVGPARIEAGGGRMAVVLPMRV